MNYFEELEIPAIKYKSSQQKIGKMVYLGIFYL